MQEIQERKMGDEYDKNLQYICMKLLQSNLLFYVINMC